MSSVQSALLVRYLGGHSDVVRCDNITQNLSRERSKDILRETTGLDLIVELKAVIVRRAHKTGRTRVDGMASSGREIQGGLDHLTRGSGRSLCFYARIACGSKSSPSQLASASLRAMYIMYIVEAVFDTYTTYL